MAFSAFILIIIINIVKIHNQNIKYKCGVDSLAKKEIREIRPNPIVYNNPLYTRRLQDIDKDGFKKFNIYMDMTNIEKEIELYELEDYSDLFIQSINKAIDTLENLLKVYPQGDILDNNLYDDISYYLEIDYWDKDKFGTKAIEKGITLLSLDIDLLIFGKFEDMEEGVLASAT